MKKFAIGLLFTIGFNAVIAMADPPVNHTPPPPNQMTPLEAADLRAALAEIREQELELRIKLAPAIETLNSLKKYNLCFDENGKLLDKIDKSGKITRVSVCPSIPSQSPASTLPKKPRT